MSEDQGGPLPEEFFEPTPREPKTIRDLLEKIEHNTGVIRAWVRFFGVVWVLTFFLYLFYFLMIASPRR